MGLDRCSLSAAVVLGAFWGAACGGSDAMVAATQLERASSAVQKGASSFTAPNSNGIAQTIRADGGAVLDEGNPFFESLGTNGRSCSTCHAASDNMTVTPSHLQARFAATDGLDPIFRPVDGANSPMADVSTLEARRSAYSMLLNKGLIRIGLPLPTNAEFELIDVKDPYAFATASELSLFRRILPATNLMFLSTVMWDGREKTLGDQANHATLGHEQSAAALKRSQQQSIVDFELQLFTAQIQAGATVSLDADGAHGGPLALSTQSFFLGINDPLGLNPTGAAFDPVVMNEYTGWRGSNVSTRAAIARGQDLFNLRSIRIADVSGLNDEIGQAVVMGTCTTCHDTPHAGNHSLPAPLRIGTDRPHPVGGLDTSGLPQYTLQNKRSGEVVTTTDPGRALITGHWKDVGRFKGPILRGLSGRAPYFHNGSAASLADVVRFYDARFELGLTDAERADLVAFLGAL